MRVIFARVHAVSPSDVLVEPTCHLSTWPSLEVPLHPDSWPMFLSILFTPWQLARSLVPTWWLLPELPGGDGAHHWRSSRNFLDEPTDALDAESTNAVIGKGFETASPALGSLALFGAYSFGAGDSWVFVSFFFHAIRVCGVDHGCGESGQRVGAGRYNRKCVLTNCWHRQPHFPPVRLHQELFHPGSLGECQLLLEWALVRPL